MEEKENGCFLYRRTATNITQKKLPQLLKILGQYEEGSPLKRLENLLEGQKLLPTSDVKQIPPAE